MTKQSKQDRHDIDHLKMFWIPQARDEVTRTKWAAKKARVELKAHKDRLRLLKARVRMDEHG